MQYAQPHPQSALILDQVGDAVITTAPDFTITSWNRAASELYGYAASEAIGAGAAALLRTEWLAEEDRQAAIVELTSKGSWRGDVRQYHRDGRPLDIRSEVRTLVAPDGALLGAVATNQDMTARRRAEAVLRNVERHLIEVQLSEVLGHLASNVAHDFNNLLAVIQGHSDLALYTLPPDSPAGRSLDKIVDTVTRATALSRELLLVSRGEDRDARNLDVPTVVRGVAEVLRCLIGSSNRLKLELPNAPLIVFASVREVHQVLFNLSMNARESLTVSGVVTVRVGESPGAVTLTVTDTGAGMSPITRAQATAPFFTTRTARRASGLGLTVVTRIAERRGGHVTIASEEGAGTAVTFTLPAADVTEGR